MTEGDNFGTRTLRFTSSKNKPLAFVADTAISLGQFQADVNQLRLQLPQNGYTMISCHGRYAFGVALLASWLEGKTVVLPPDNRGDTVQNIRNRFDISFECDSDWAMQVPGHDCNGSHGCWELQLPADMTAVELFTSGSTGSPKVIGKSVANLLDEARTIASTIDWPDGPVVAGVPAQHLFGLTFSLLLPWVRGNTWVDDLPRYPADISQVIRQCHGKILINVPSHYQAALNEGASLRGILCISSAAPLSSSLASHWKQQSGADILEIYGSTETGVVGYRRQLVDESWQAFPEVQLSVERNLLKVDSPFVSKRYARGCHTADRVTLADLGTFRLLGRADAIIKIAGKRVSLTRIENSLCSCPGVVDAAVIAVPANGVVRDMAIWAAVVTAGGSGLNSRQIQSVLRDKLDGIEMPRRILVVDQLPRLENGKLPSKAVAGLFDDHDQASVQV